MRRPGRPGCGGRRSVAAAPGFGVHGAPWRTAVPSSSASRATKSLPTSCAGSWTAPPVRWSGASSPTASNTSVWWARSSIATWCWSGTVHFALRLACAIVKYGARRLSLVVPYFGYSTMRAVKPGEGGHRQDPRPADLGSIPACEGWNACLPLRSPCRRHRVLLRAIRTSRTTSTARRQITAAASAIPGWASDSFVLGAHRRGPRQVRAEHLAHDLGVEPAFILQAPRLEHREAETQVTAINADVRGAAR
jgi:hypothetical protein